MINVSSSLKKTSTVNSKGNDHHLGSLKLFKNHSILCVGRLLTEEINKNKQTNKKLIILIILVFSNKKRSIDITILVILADLNQTKFSLT